MNSPIASHCPSCASNQLTQFYEAKGVPVNSVLMIDSHEEALRFPVGDIQLMFCDGCGLIFNAAFNPELPEYSERSEETQGFSATFNNWHQELAASLIERFSLRGKHLIEIGCGKGEFLSLLCDLGGNTGLGYDPAYVESRSRAKSIDGVNFVADYFSEQQGQQVCDFLCCKMTLEHIPNVREFVQTIHGALSGQAETRVFFQVPDVLRILEEQAFWDIYYEHCTYFSAGSLARLFRAVGFNISDVSRVYDEQYLAIDAQLSGGGQNPSGLEADLQQLKEKVQHFTQVFPERLKRSNERLAQYQHDGSKVVLWGSGSKAAAFLTTLDASSGIDYVVDINPHRQGKYMPKTAQQIVSPEFLQSYQPDVVVVMNPVYKGEIEAELERQLVAPSLVCTANDLY